MKTIFFLALSYAAFGQSGEKQKTPSAATTPAQHVKIQTLEERAKAGTLLKTIDSEQSSTFQICSQPCSSLSVDTPALLRSIEFWTTGTSEWQVFVKPDEKYNALSPETQWVFRIDGKAIMLSGAELARAVKISDILSRLSPQVITAVADALEEAIKAKEAKDAK